MVIIVSSIKRGTKGLYELDKRTVTTTIMDVKVQISELNRECARMITQTAEYALRAVVYLAGQDLPRTTAQIAETTRVPAGYLAKVMQNLSRAGLVKSQRGLNGGFTLAHDPKGLSILAVINAVDPIQRFPECPLGIPSHGRRLCPLHYRLDQAAAMVEKAFGGTMVAELLAVPRDRRALCRFPMETKVPS